jgi:ADP-L-glycero-D-manno-heptose 6-epimerase
VYIVTGACGFIGSNLIRHLNRRGEEDLLVVDEREPVEAGRNLEGARFAEAAALDTFRVRLKGGRLPAAVRGILHQGACADTMETDEAYMMDRNLAFSEELLRFALERRIPFVYASSASVYGRNRESAECRENEAPLNLYARSKLAFDEVVRPLLPKTRSTVAGLRYFNVYGPREAHKGRMASMAYQLYRQLRTHGRVRLFEGCDGYERGEQRRDFVHVDDVAAVNAFFLDGPPRGEIVNVGTGRARSFNDVARILIDRCGGGEIEYIPFPGALRGKYQSFTEANLDRLRACGYADDFLSLEEGLARAVEAWKAEEAAGG